MRAIKVSQLTLREIQRRSGKESSVLPPSRYIEIWTPKG